MDRFESVVGEERGRALVASAGAAALAVAALISFNRMEDTWAAFPLLLLVGVPSLLLLGLALRAGDLTPAPGWRPAFFVASFLVGVVADFQLFVVLGNEDPGSTVATIVFAFNAVLAWWVSTRYDTPIMALLAGFFAVLAALALISWLDSDAGVDAFRNVLIVIGILLLLASRMQEELRRLQAHLLVAVGGIALIAAGLLGAIGDQFDTVFASFVSPFGLEEAEQEFEDREGWELVILAVSLAMIAYSVWQRYRGAAYVGIAGLVAFGALTLAQGSLWGWPVILAVLAVGAIGYGAMANGRGPATPVAPPPGPAAPTATAAPPTAPAGERPPGGPPAP